MSRWPDGERVAAEQLLASLGEARALLEEARRSVGSIPGGGDAATYTALTRDRSGRCVALSRRQRRIFHSSPRSRRFTPREHTPEYGRAMMKLGAHVRQLLLP
jgi:hypothetical protein